MAQTPWAIILCKFSDIKDVPYDRLRYEEIFTTKGNGKWNMVDYFHDMSHGKLDLSGSKVFGWYTLDKKLSDYTGSGANPERRSDLITWAREAATDAGEDLSQFSNRIIACYNEAADLFGGGIGVACGDNGSDASISGFCPSLMGQEMGHVYGLLHSREEGSTDDYKDRWDVMSNITNTIADHPIYTERTIRGESRFPIGPGLNAANMHSRGWLDETRVWSMGAMKSVNTTVQLRPLHRRDLTGYLAIRFHDYFIEFRTNSGWDVGIKNPVVLVHRLEDDISYIVSDTKGSQAFYAGSWTGTPENMSLYGSIVRIEVENIDPANDTASIRLISVAANVPQYFPDPDRPYRNPGIAWGVDDAIISLGYKTMLIRRQSPLFTILENIVLHESAADIPISSIQDRIRQEAITNITNVVQQKFEVLDLRTPHLPKFD